MLKIFYFLDASKSFRITINGKRRLDFVFVGKKESFQNHVLSIPTLLNFTSRESLWLVQQISRQRQLRLQIFTPHLQKLCIYSHCLVFHADWNSNVEHQTGNRRISRFDFPRFHFPRIFGFHSFYVRLLYSVYLPSIILASTT